MNGNALSAALAHPVVVVFAYGLITALATGLGAVPFAFVSNVSARTVAIANAIASGLMLGASFGLVIEGGRIGMVRTLAGGVLGVVFILIAERALHDRDVHVADLRGAGARRALLLLLVMTMHSFAEGVAVGVSFGGGQKLALLITLAIAVHNIPEGLAISAVLRPQGSSLLACAGWSVVSSLPQPLMAVPAFLFVDAFGTVLPYGLGFAAGAMVFLVLLELLPEAYAEVGPVTVGWCVAVSLGAMVLFQRLI